MIMHPIRSPLAWLLAVAASATAQDAPPPAKDPFTGGQEKAMQALGVVAYAPLRWADNLSTTDVDRVLGESRILWIETAHFRIGSTLKTIEMPDDAEARKELVAECARLAKKHNKVPKKPKKLDAWHRLHLHAQRAEEMYAEFAELIGSTDGTTPAGPYLGLPDKYLVLLFEKKSDLARYSDRFCGRALQTGSRHFHETSRQEAVMTTAEADPPHDEPALHSQFNYMLASALTDGLDGRVSSTPEWLRLGLAHVIERRVTTQLITTAMHEDERVEPQTQHLWKQKMWARAQHESLLTPIDKLMIATDFGYYLNVQAWSRVDFLLQRDRGKFGAFLLACKKEPTASKQLTMIEDLFGLDAAAFDAQWREWVLKTYK